MHQDWSAKHPHVTIQNGYLASCCLQLQESHTCIGKCPDLSHHARMQSKLHSSLHKCPLVKGHSAYVVSSCLSQAHLKHHVSGGSQSHAPQTSSSNRLLPTSCLYLGYHAQVGAHADETGVDAAAHARAGSKLRGQVQQRSPAVVDVF